MIENLSRVTVKKKIIDWQIFKTFAKEKRETLSTMKLKNFPAPDLIDKLLCHLQCFSKDERKKRLRARNNVQFSKDASGYIGELKLTVLFVLTGE